MGLMNHLFNRNCLAICKQFKCSSNQDQILNISKHLLIQNQDVRNAGHSKWQNIRHTKASKDGIKSKVYGKIALATTKAALKGTDPKLNKELANVLELARRENVSKEVIDRALKRAANLKLEVRERGFVGPNNEIGIVYFLYDVRFNRPSNFLKHIHVAFRNFKFVDPKMVVSHFHKRGFIYISKYDRNKNPVPFEKIEEVAIESEAEEIEINSDEDKIVPPLPEVIDDGNKKGKSKREQISVEEDDDLIDTAFFWKLIISEENIFAAKGTIERDYPDLVIKSHDIEYVAKDPVNLSASQLEKFNKFAQELSEIEEFEKMYTNINV